MDVWIARQPICDASRRIVAYELLHRTASGDAGSGAAATTEVLLHGLFTFGLDRLAGDHLAFVNVPQDLLGDPRLRLFPPDRIGFEILEDTPPTKANLGACRQLSDAGFHLYLDDFWGQEHLLPFLDFVDCIKVDWPSPWGTARKLLFDWQRRHKKLLLAEKLEDNEQFLLAVEYGFDRFQGYFLQRPQVLSGQRLPASASSRVRLLRLLADDSSNLESLADAVLHDPELSLLLLKWVNSARFARHFPATSVLDALLWLGENESRRWLTVLLLPILAPGAVRSTLSAMMTRARFAELIFASLLSPAEARKVFLVSLVSDLVILAGLSPGAFATHFQLPTHLLGFVEQIHAGSHCRSMLRICPAGLRILRRPVV